MNESPHTSWESIKAEHAPALAAWRRDHPIRSRWIAVRFHLRLWIYRCTRIDIG